MQHLVTRAKNANQHPGRVIKRKRCTKAEIEHDRAQLVAQKEAEKQEHQEKIANVAQLEDKMAVDKANIGSAHPQSRKGILAFFICHIQTDDTKKRYQNGKKSRNEL